jgi:hypothetical protein
MSLMHAKILRESRAIRAFENHAAKLELELAAGVAPVEQMRLRVELLEEHIENTGGSVLTQHYRVALSELKKRVVLTLDDEPPCPAATHGGRNSTCTCEDSRDE